ncbi:MAG: response regulator transcription factor [Desulfobulbaceae bacterium]|nr:response regulator transcription factor [Desulfobulbaceae bacterium]
MANSLTKETIWVVEDEEDLLALIYYNFVKEGFEVKGFASGEEMFTSLTQTQPDLMLLDVMLPGIDGLEICKRLKANTKTSLLPVIMLTAKGEEGDIVTGLNLGADDYIPKPFSPKVLIARVRSVLRRRGAATAPPTGVINHGELAIDSNRHEVRLSGHPLPLTATEFKILTFLAQKPGWVFSRDQIINAIHDGDIAVTDRTVDVQIVALRKKLGPKQHCIETVRGIGYKFQG